jgi:hypothetical protein
VDARVIFGCMNSERGINRRGAETQRLRRVSALALRLCVSAVKSPSNDMALCRRYSIENLPNPQNPVVSASIERRM